MRWGYASFAEKAAFRGRKAGLVSGWSSNTESAAGPGRGAVCGFRLQLFTGCCGSKQA